MAQKKSRLTQSQWLNIIIIVTSAAFLLFVLLSNKLNQSIDNQSKNNKQNNFQLADYQLVEIDFGEFKIRNINPNINQVWQSDDVRLTSLQVKNIANHWQKLIQSQGQAITDEPDSAKTVLLFFAEFDQPIIAKLSQSKQATRITVLSIKAAYILPADAYSNYYPQIFAE